MIALTFAEPQNDPEWTDWCKRSASAVAAMMNSPSDSSRLIDDRLYKEQRDRFLLATHKKCAYCETFLPPGERKGDVEHYRPKARVRDGDGNIVRIRNGDTEQPHPGYFWLAYDFRNLLPSCAACNRRATDARSGELTGKSDIFPTLDNWWASSPQEVADELPVLLNPWIDEPETNLRFDPLTGLVAGTTERGRGTVDLLGLNRDGLVEERLEACGSVAEAFCTLTARLSHTHSATLDRLKRIKTGEAQYAAICRVQLVACTGQLREALDAIGVEVS